jgi:hypothetical protein
MIRPPEKAGKPQCAVRELQGGTSNVGFDYRLVARRADSPGVRLENVDEPPSYYQPEPAEHPIMPGSPLPSGLPKHADH